MMKGFRTKITLLILLRVIPALTHHSDIVSDIQYHLEVYMDIYYIYVVFGI